MIARAPARRTRAGVVLLPLLVTFVLGCAVRFISDYDEVTDRAVSALQADVEGFLFDMVSAAGTPGGEYENNLGFYRDAGVELNVLLTRARAIPQNDLAVQQLELLRDSFDELAEMHREQGAGGLPTALVEPLLASLRTHFGAILKLELAKKRGK